MRKSITLILTLLALIGAVVYFLSAQREVTTAPENFNQTDIVQSPTDQDIQSALSASAESKTNHSPPANPLIDSDILNRPLEVPLSKDLRQEVARDPHRTPPGLIRFSISLGAKMGAIQNFEQAARFSVELGSCARGNSKEFPESAMALCLLNAKRLSARFPELSTEFKNLQNSVDPTVLELMNQLN
ncbi:MAG: hypothetical protein IT289_11325 [Oligoflexia bacterium]|nr:hypothetical protein [Oligoflexia bacterium]